MIISFWRSFLVAAVQVALALGAAGFLVAHFAAPPPPERFVSSVFQFDLPKDWKCKKDGLETVCWSDSSPKAARCILVMKERGPKDTEAMYLKHLSAPIASEIVSKSGNGINVRSEVIRVGRRQIKGYIWVNGLHFQSEVINYYTEYFAVTTSHIAVLVTFSIHKDHVEKHRKELETMISSLRVYQQL